MYALVHWYSDAQGFGCWVHKMLPNEVDDLQEAKARALREKPPEEGMMPYAVQDIDNGQSLCVGEHMLEIPSGVWLEYRAFRDMAATA